jgi:hypothetical protein
LLSFNVRFIYQYLYFTILMNGLTSAELTGEARHQ